MGEVGASLRFSEEKKHQSLYLVHILPPNAHMFLGKLRFLSRATAVRLQEVFFDICASYVRWSPLRKSYLCESVVTFFHLRAY